MKCVKCGSYQVQVIDTRNDREERRIYRRRRCLRCSHRWTTVELPVGDLKTAAASMADAVRRLEGKDGKKHHTGG